MDFGAIAKSIWAQFVTVWNEPVPFIAALLLVGFIIWKAVQREFATRLANADSTIQMLQERLDRSETNDAIAIAATSQQVETTGPPPEVRPRAVPAQPVTPAVGSKVYVSGGINAEYIASIYEKGTTLQVQRALQSEVGKWMVVEGPIRGVNAIMTGPVMVSVRTAERQMTFCVFRTIPPEVEEFSEGDMAKIEGRIDDVSGVGVTLEDCILISSRPASPSPPS